MCFIMNIDDKYSRNSLFTSYLYNKYPPLLSVKMLGEIIDVKEQTIRNWIQNGECPIPYSEDADNDSVEQKSKKKFPLRFRITDVAAYLEKIFSRADSIKKAPTKMSRGRPTKAMQMAKKFASENDFSV